jgi:hypothetical protein
MCFKFSLLFLLIILSFSSVLAQKKVKKKPAVPNLKDTLEFITAKIKSTVNYTDSKGSADCSNQSVKKIDYQEVKFAAESNLEMNLTDEITRLVCSSNLMNDATVTSTSIGYDETKISVPLRQLNSSAIKTGSCTLENGYERKVGSCFFVGLETLNNLKAFKIEKINSFKFNEKLVTDKKAVSFTTNQYQIYFPDVETAESVAKAFAQAIKLSGGN